MYPPKCWMRGCFVYCCNVIPDLDQLSCPTPRHGPPPYATCSRGRHRYYDLYGRAASRRDADWLYGVCTVPNQGSRLRRPRRGDRIAENGVSCGWLAHVKRTWWSSRTPAGKETSDLHHPYNPGWRQTRKHIGRYSRRKGIVICSCS